MNRIKRRDGERCKSYSGIAFAASSSDPPGDSSAHTHTLTPGVEPHSQPAASRTKILTHPPPSLLTSSRSSGTGLFFFFIFSCQHFQVTLQCINVVSLPQPPSTSSFFFSSVLKCQGRHLRHLPGLCVATLLPPPRLRLQGIGNPCFTARSLFAAGLLLCKGSFFLNYEMDVLVILRRESLGETNSIKKNYYTLKVRVTALKKITKWCSQRPQSFQRYILKEVLRELMRRKRRIIRRKRKRKRRGQRPRYGSRRERERRKAKRGAGSGARSGAGRQGG